MVVPSQSRITTRSTAWHDCLIMLLYKWEACSHAVTACALRGAGRLLRIGDYKRWGTIAGGRFARSTGLLRLVTAGLIFDLGFTLAGFALYYQRHTKLQKYPLERGEYQPCCLLNTVTVILELIRNGCGPPQHPSRRARPAVRE